MSSQYWESVLTAPAHTADGAAYHTSTTITDISPTPNLVLPANYLYPGSVLRVHAFGRYSTTGTPTLLLGVYYGAVAGVALAETGAITTPSGVTNITWILELDIFCRTAGTSGTVIAAGKVFGINAATNSVNYMPATAPATATINTTAASALTIGADWGTSSALNTITCHAFYVESLV